jgi:hypothetical protein
MKPIQEWSDSFGKQVSSTRNKLDLPSHYDINPERFRVRENGTRVEATESTFVIDGDDSFDLAPGVGNSVSFYTAERPRYVVNYESESSWACQTNEPLEAGDTLEIGLRDYETNENKVFFEFTEGDTRDTNLDVVVQKNGSELKRRTVDLDEVAPGFDITQPFRPYIDFNWYGVGPYKFGVTYTDSAAKPGEKQYNKLTDELAITGETSTSEANFHLYFSFDQATEGKVVNAGSCGYILKGTPDATTRAKAARFTELPYGGSGEYEPILAIRVDPERANVFSEVTESEIIFNAGDGEMLIISCSPNLTDADFITDPTGDGATTGPVSPPQHNSTNSVIQYTTDVTTFPDQDNNIVTTTLDPGGYQISFSSSDAPGQGTSATRASSNLQRKRPLHSDNVGILLAKRDTSQSTDVNPIFETEQDW